MHRPRVNRGTKHKPSKGFNMFRAQNRKAQERKKALEAVRLNAADKASWSGKVKSQWKKLQRWFSLSRHLRGKYTPHQGVQECTRRVRQMNEHKCIHPEVWN